MKKAKEKIILIGLLPSLLLLLIILISPRSLNFTIFFPYIFPGLIITVILNRFIYDYNKYNDFFYKKSREYFKLYFIPVLIIGLSITIFSRFFLALISMLINDNAKSLNIGTYIFFKYIFNFSILYYITFNTTYLEAIIKCLKNIIENRKKYYKIINIIILIIAINLILCHFIQNINSESKLKIEAVLDLINQFIEIIILLKYSKYLISENKV